MRVPPTLLTTSAFVIAMLHAAPHAQAPAPRSLPPISSTPVPAVATLASRLDLERYKTTIKGLTQFGDRRQGTERNRKAVDWVEAQLRSYGCPADRIKSEYQPNPPNTAGRGGAAGGRGGGRGTLPPGGGRFKGVRARTGV